MSLVERLKQLPKERVGHDPPAPSSEIDDIESVTGFRLPADLRELLEWSNGLEIRSATPFSMMNAYDLAYSPSEPHFKEDLPGMLILGSDNGGSIYYADPSNQVGRGAWAVYLVRMSEMGIPHSMFVGSSFTEAIETLLTDADIFKRPQIGAKPSAT